MEDDLQKFIAAHSDDELLKMVFRPDPLDPSLHRAAEEELKRRNTLPEDFEDRRKKIIDDEDEVLSDGRPASFPQEFFGWLGILGVLGIIIGYNLYFGKSVSQYTGKEYPRYDEMSRESGRYMFYVSLATHTLFILFKVVPWVERMF